MLPPKYPLDHRQGRGRSPVPRAARPRSVRAGLAEVTVDGDSGSVAGTEFKRHMQKLSWCQATGTCFVGQRLFEQGHRLSRPINSDKRSDFCNAH